MKKTWIFLSLFILVSCGKEIIPQNCFKTIRLNEIIYLDNPEFINLNVPGGHTFTNIGGRKIIIIRQTDNHYKAFDLECPEQKCTTPMKFDGLKLYCLCNKKQYNSLNGMPIDGEGCPVLEYTTSLNGNTLIITR